MTGRLPVTLVAVAGALVAVLAAQATDASTALGLATLAGLGLGMMLAGTRLRVLAVLVVLLAIGGGVRAAANGAWIALAGFVVAGIGSAATAAWGPGWLRRSPEQAKRLDDWAAMDAGLDPTNDDELDETSRG